MQIGFQAASCSETLKRKGRLALILFLTCLSSVWLGAQSLPSAPPALVLQQLVSGLTSPVDFEFPNDGTGRFFILEQTGKVRIIQGGVLLSSPFLDITNLLESGGEKGLLGLAFHPLYAQNGRFFVNYTRRVSGQLQTV